MSRNFTLLGSPMNAPRNGLLNLANKLIQIRLASTYIWIAHHQNTNQLSAVPFRRQSQTVKFLKHAQVLVEFICTFFANKSCFQKLKLFMFLVERKPFTPEIRNYGFRVFFPEEDEELQELICDDGSITIKVYVKKFLFKSPIFSKEVDDEVHRFEKCELQKISASMIQMIEFNSQFEEGKIIKVVAKDQVEFLVKTDILSSRSPVFQAMSQSCKWKEGEGSLVLKELSGKTVKVLLHHLYGGVLLKDDWKAEDVILELTWAAQKYQLDSLSDFLDKILPVINFNNTDVLARLALLAKRLKMENAERGLFSKLKETATDIDQLILDKEGSLLGID